jgi:inhibitor of KinA sporulation pathway (predicted exonuclease)
MALIILELEATCDEVETEAISGANREIIELGALKFDLESGQTLNTFRAFVRPVVNPELTAFCKNLLGISQADVDAADTFPAVRSAFLAWAAEGAKAEAWASWGNFDVHQWKHDAARYGQLQELPWRHINLKKGFARALDLRRCGIGGAYTELGMEIGDIRHRALTDAELIANLLEQVPSFREYVKNVCAAER